MLLNGFINSQDEIENFISKCKSLKIKKGIFRQSNKLKFK